MSIDNIKADIKAIVSEKNCGPIFIRLSWHDAGVYSTGKLTGGKINDKKSLCRSVSFCLGVLTNIPNI